MSDAFADLMSALPVEGLVPGESVGIDELAQRMLRWSELFGDAGRALARIEVEWSGPAADAFQSQFQLQPAAFTAAATAMDDAGYALGSYGISFDSARQAAGIALETFQRGVRAGLAARTAAAAVAAAAGGFLPTSGPVDLRDEPAGLQDRLAGVEKLTAARQALGEAGDRAAASVRDAMVTAPPQVTAWEHARNVAAGMLPWVSNQEKSDFYVGGARGLLDMGAQAAMPATAPLVMAPVNQALDGLEWRWNIGTGSGFHRAGALIIPTIATAGTGAAGGAAAAVEARAPRLLAEVITPKGVNPEPVLLYRGMRAAEDGYPEAGATAKSLGARPLIMGPKNVVEGDLRVEADGSVRPLSGGMSANTDPYRIPSFRRPPSFDGIGKGLDMFSIEEGQMPVGLVFRQVEPYHGYIEPGRPMSYDEMQRLIHSTRFQWRKVIPNP